MLHNSLQCLYHTPRYRFIHKLSPLPFPSLSVSIPTSDLFLFCLALWNTPKSQFHIYLHLSLSDPGSGHWHAQRDMADPNSQLSGRHVIYLEIQFEYSRNKIYCPCVPKSGQIRAGSNRVEVIREWESETQDYFDQLNRHQALESG
jgi:hypothetical protein